MILIDFPRSLDPPAAQFAPFEPPVTQDCENHAVRGARSVTYIYTLRFLLTRGRREANKMLVIYIETRRGHLTDRATQVRKVPL